MKILLVVLACLTLGSSVLTAQKSKAGAGYFPLGYSGDTWTGKVSSFDNEHRTLTLTSTDGHDVQTFIATLPDAPYEWTYDSNNQRVLDFPFDKSAKSQTFKWDGPGFAATILPDRADPGVEMKVRPNPPDDSRISDFADFKGRTITVYFSARKRKVGAKDENYNDVWRIRVWPKK